MVLALRHLDGYALNPVSVMRTIRERVFDILEVSITGKRDFSWYFDITLLTVIILNVLAIILESVASIYTDYVAYFRAFEYFSIVFFSVEYVLRVWSITVDANYRHPI